MTKFNNSHLSGNSLNRNYSEPTTFPTANGTNGKVVQNGGIHKGKTRKTTVNSDYNNGSMLSAKTEDTYILTNSTKAYVENYPSSDTNSQGGGSSQVSLLNGNSSHGSHSTMNYDEFDDYYQGVPTVLDFDSFRLIFQGEIGRVRKEIFAS
jgi:hypothetical protein